MAKSRKETLEVYLLYPTAVMLAVGIIFLTAATGSIIEGGLNQASIFLTGSGALFLSVGIFMWRYCI